MAYSGLKVDGITYPNIHIASVKRDGEVLDGKNSGRVTSGNMVRDVIGTYYNYTIVVDCDDATVGEYDNLYEVLTAPVDYHTIEAPYAQSYISFKAYVSSVSDELKYIHGTTNRWGSMSLKIVAMNPYRRA